MDKESMIVRQAATRAPMPVDKKNGRDGDVDHLELKGKLEKLSKRLRTVLIIFRRGSDQPAVVPENLPVEPGDSIYWKVITEGEPLDYVILEFANGVSYFPFEPYPHRTMIKSHNGDDTALGQVTADHPVGIDKYCVEWKFSGENPDRIDPIIIVTDP